MDWENDGDSWRLRSGRRVYEIAKRAKHKYDVFRHAGSVTVDCGMCCSLDEAKELCEEDLEWRESLEKRF